MVIPINTTISNFYRYYLETLNPVLHLSSKEMDVLEALLKVYYKNRTNPEINNLLFNTNTLRVIRESLKLSTGSFNNIKSSLRSKNVIKDNSINPLILKGLNPKKQPNSNYKNTITYDINIIPEKLKAAVPAKTKQTAVKTPEHV